MAQKKKILLLDQNAALKVNIFGIVFQMWP
jgi:hypothetical protein